MFECPLNSQDNFWSVTNFLECWEVRKCHSQTLIEKRKEIFIKLLEYALLETEMKRRRERIEHKLTLLYLDSILSQTQDN